MPVSECKELMWRVKLKKFNRNIVDRKLTDLSTFPNDTTTTHKGVSY